MQTMKSCQAMRADQQRQTLIMCQLCANYVIMQWEFVANDGDAHQHTGVASCCWAGDENVVLEKASKQRLTHGI